jgi:hypothetical protein
MMITISIVYDVSSFPILAEAIRYGDFPSLPLNTFITPSIGPKDVMNGSVISSQHPMEGLAQTFPPDKPSIIGRLSSLVLLSKEPQNQESKDPFQNSSTAVISLSFRFRVCKFPWKMECNLGMSLSKAAHRLVMATFQYCKTMSSEKA